MKDFHFRLFTHIVFFLAAFLRVAGAESPNLMPESGGFEAGWSGFQVLSLTNPQNGPRLLPPSLDSSTAAQGQRSLKLVNGSGEEILLVLSHALRLPSEGQTTLSLYAKSDPPGVPVTVSLNNGWKEVIATTIKPAVEWNRYHITATPKQWFFQDLGGMQGVYYLKIQVPATARWKTLWIDGVQLEQGDLSEFVPSAPVEIAFEMDRELKVYHPEEVPGMVLRVAGAGVARRKVRVVCEDLFSEKKEPAIELVLEADGDNDHAKVQIPTLARPRGAYRYTAKVEGSEVSRQQVYGVIVSMKDRPVADRKFFGFSSEYVMMAQNWRGVLPSEDHSITVWGYDLEKICNYSARKSFGELKISLVL